jgi:hypothetical protein
MEVDEFAKRLASEQFVLPSCLHVPIAARDETAIRTFVGEVTEVLVSGSPNRALLVSVEPRQDIIQSLPIWSLPEATVLHRTRQLWVHVDFGAYRSAYARAFPDEDIRSLVIDHIMNRRVARLKDFMYLRVIPISREANSSSGGLSEKWAVEYYQTPEMQAKSLASPARVQHADLADIVKMLNRKTGGALQDPVNEAQVLVREVPPPMADD